MLLTLLFAASLADPPAPPVVSAGKPHARPAAAELKFDKGVVKLTAPE